MPNLDSYPQDEFNAIAERVEMHYMPVEHVSVEVKILRDVVSLRKLNNNLISVSWMDDFLVDCYMKIYKLVRQDGRRPETAISIDMTSREASVNGEGEESSSRRPSRVSRKEILQKVFALCKPPPAPAKTVLTHCNISDVIGERWKIHCRGKSCIGRRGNVSKIRLATTVWSSISRSNGHGSTHSIRSARANVDKDSNTVIISIEATFAALLNLKKWLKINLHCTSRIIDVEISKNFWV